MDRNPPNISVAPQTFSPSTTPCTPLVMSTAATTYPARSAAPRAILIVRSSMIFGCDQVNEQCSPNIALEHQRCPHLITTTKSLRHASLIGGYRAQTNRVRDAIPYIQCITVGDAGTNGPSLIVSHTCIQFHVYRGHKRVLGNT